MITWTPGYLQPESEKKKYFSLGGISLQTSEEKYSSYIAELT